MQRWVSPLSLIPFYEIVTYLSIKHKILYRYMFQTYLQLQNFMIKNNIYYY